MQFGRRLALRHLSLGLGLGLGGLGGLGLGIATSPASAASPPTGTGHDADHGKSPVPVVAPDSGRDETARLQAAIDRAAERRMPLSLPAGRYITRGLTLRAGSRVSGVAGATVIEHVGEGPALRAVGPTGARLADIAVEGFVVRGASALATGAKALIDFENIDGLRLAAVTIERCPANGIALSGCGGVVTGCRITGAAKAAIFSIDATGLEISHNTILDCANNGILVWRSRAGDDGTVVAMNRIERIAARDGGSGQNGNAINVFRAGGVIVDANRIADCAFSAVRANSASDVQMTGNNIARMGEVALYAEFAFAGAVISGNVIDGAGTGISVTNFNEGGRLAVVQGNVVRNLRQRPADRDRSGIGIAVEADTASTGNVVEEAPTAGLAIGWGPFCRDIAATGNVIRRSGIGIAVSGDAKAGPVLISGNMISGASRGAIRAMDHGRPIGDDLASEAARTGETARIASRIRATGNVVS